MDVPCNQNYCTVWTLIPCHSSISVSRDLVSSCMDWLSLRWTIHVEKTNKYACDIMLCEYDEGVDTLHVTLVAVSAILIFAGCIQKKSGKYSGANTVGPGIVFMSLKRARLGLGVKS